MKDRYDKLMIQYGGSIPFKVLAKEQEKEREELCAKLIAIIITSSAVGHISFGIFRQYYYNSLLYLS